MKKKIIIIILVLVVIATIVFFYFQKKKKNIKEEITNKENGKDTNVTSVINFASPYLKTNATFPLVNGSKGKQVAHLQKYLNNGVINPPYAMQFPNLVVDGIIGTKTAQALANVGYSMPISQEFYNTKIPQTFKL